MRPKLAAGVLAFSLPLTLGESWVKLSGGDAIKGSECPGSPVKMFRGIPYAQAPTGHLRFMPPQRLNETLGGVGKVFDASQPASPCPQFNTEFVDDSPTPSEDCLTVDIYTSASQTTGVGLPVKVWAYGGFNEVGGTSEPLYGACHLATDSVVVEFNYRVGALGFLALENAGIQGNMAIQDFLAALQWVQDNISSFGGDKNRVVLFGQSAGADDTWVVSTLPESQGLITGVITESGGGQFMTPNNIAQKVGASYAAALNCSDDNLACLQSLSLQELEVTYQTIPAIVNSNAPAQMIANLYAANIPRTYNMDNAILDGKIIVEEPLEVGPHVPIVAGATQEDASLFTIPLFEESKYAVTRQNYTDFLEAWGPDIGPRIGRLYPLSAFNDTGSDSEAVVAAITYIATRSAFICPSYYILRAAESAGMDAFGYRFNHTPSCPWLREPGIGAFPSKKLASVFGPTHTSELPFIFGNLDNLPLPGGNCNSTNDEYIISGQLRKSWTAMSGGSPATRTVDWPPFSGKQEEGVLVQDAVSVARLDFEECDFWAGIWGELAGKKLSWM